MSTLLLLSLAGLALLDSTSIGTLFIPVWLLLSPGRVSVPRVVLYLATIAGFYFAVGLVLVFGGSWLIDTFGGVLDRTPVRYAQFALGVGLFLLSFRYGKKRKGGGGVALRWRDRAMSGESSGGWLAGLALLAALAEVATMLPYLGAVGIMAAADVSGWTSVALLAGYCLVMVLPALVLLVLRVAASGTVEPILHRLNDLISKNASSATGWILGIAGFLIARDAALRLWF